MSVTGMEQPCFHRSADLSRYKKTREQQPHVKGAQNAGRVHDSRIEQEEGYRPAGRIWLLGRNEIRQVLPKLNGGIRQQRWNRFPLYGAF